MVVRLSAGLSLRASAALRGRHVQEPSTTVTVALLGPPIVARDGQPIRVDTRKAIALLAYLAVSERPSPRPALCSLLWPEYDEPNARGALRRTLSVLNAALGGEGLAIERSTIGIVPAAVVLDLAQARTALVRVEAHHPDGRTGGCRRCLAELRAAAALVRGDFMEGFGLRDSEPYEAWERMEAEEARTVAGRLLARLSEALAERGELTEALTVARRRLSLDPLDEPAHRFIMGLLADTGDVAGAVRQYRTCVRLLDAELGVPPLPETVTLYEAIASGTPTAGVSVSPTAPIPAPSPTQAAAADPSSSDVPEPDAELVGRAGDLAVLRRAARDARHDGWLAVVEGEAGIGKTRLLETLAAEVEAAGGRVLQARAHAGEQGLAFAAVVDWLRQAWSQPRLRAGLSEATEAARAEAGRLLPELAAGLAPPLTLDEQAARTRFLAGLADVLASALGADHARAEGSGAGGSAVEGSTVRPSGSEGPVGLLLLDDAHWADEGTLDLLSWLSRRLEGRPLLVLLAWRPERVASDHPLRRPLEELRRRGRASIIRPARLTAAEVSTLVRRALPGAGPELQARVAERTEGLPVLVVEYLSALAASGDETDALSHLPPGAAELLRARLGEVDALGRQVLGAAAAMGRTFDLAMIQRVSRRTPDETVRVIDAAVAAGLIAGSPAGGQRYDFRHEAIRQQLLADMTPARLRLLHLRLADLAEQLPGPAGERAALVAQHAEAAGERARAAWAHRTAAEEARAVHAVDEALVHYRAAAALGDPDVVGLDEAIGELLTLSGDYPAAEAALETAAAHADEADLARLEWRIGAVQLRRGEAAGAARHLRAAMEGAAQPELRIRAGADLAMALSQAGDVSAALRAAEAAAEAAERSGERGLLARALGVRGWLRHRTGAGPAAERDLRRSLALAEAGGDLAARIAALNDLAQVAVADGRPEEGEPLLVAALEDCRRLGDRHRAAALEDHLADLLHHLGRQAEAAQHQRAAVAGFAEVGGRGPLEPGIWMLATW
ncbi:MAG TPA: AAA family ATPase [Candidatus Limnocylindrales bacterium]|nr:AAA family ATPase [Candidatus Limnocylindrales bacterium]